MREIEIFIRLYYSMRIFCKINHTKHLQIFLFFIANFVQISTFAKKKKI